MQYLKDEIRNKIIEEALSEFKNKGYKGTSIRSIAKNSGTSVGNMYKYFESKENLYENLIGSVFHKLMSYINKFNMVELNDKADEIFYELMDKIMEIVEGNSTELSILLNKSEGSKYENCKSNFVDFINRIVTEKMKYELSLKGKKMKDDLIMYLISNSLVESIAIVLKERENGTEVRGIILNMIDIFYKDTAGKLDSEDI